MRILAALLLFLAAIAVWVLLNPLNREVLFGEQGIITEGKKFGIEIGQDTRPALESLENLGLELNSTRVDGICQGHSFGTGKTVYVFRDSSCRNGVVCIVSHDSKMEAIGWFFLPFDF